MQQWSEEAGPIEIVRLVEPCIEPPRVTVKREYIEHRGTVRPGLWGRLLNLVGHPDSVSDSDFE